MAFAIICIALLCGVRGNPLGQTGSIYDYPLPLPVPNVGTVYENPNVIGYPYQYPVNPYLPYPRYPFPYPYPNIPSTTVCETTPNVVGILPYPNVPVPSVGSTTVCETTPSVVGYLPYPNVPISGVSVPNVGPTTVCENTPSVVGYLPFPNVPIPNVAYPNVPIPNLGGSTTVCETAPVLPVNPCISPLQYPGYPGLLPGYPYGAPYGVPFL